MNGLRFRQQKIKHPTAGVGCLTFLDAAITGTGSDIVLAVH